MALRSGSLHLFENWEIIMKPLERAKCVFDTEIEAMHSVRDNLGDAFLSILDEILHCTGKVIFIGMGKSGHVASKMAATMSSLGSCAISISPAECLHGDLGMIQKNDFVILISYSGESDEIVRIIPNIRFIGAKTACITCNGSSTLARSCSIVQVLANVKEACYLGLAPTSSTTVVMAYGDALSVAAAEAKGFGKRDFAAFHPAGSLGKKLITKTLDLMKPLTAECALTPGSTMLEAIMLFAKTNSEMIPVYFNDRFVAVLTNGDIERNLLTYSNKLSEVTVDEIDHKQPVFIDCESMASDALDLLNRMSFNALPVVRDDVVIGIIRKKDILDYGIY